MKADENNYGSSVYKLWYGFVYNLLEILIGQVATLELTECEAGPKQCVKSCFLYQKQYHKCMSSGNTNKK